MTHLSEPSNDLLVVMAGYTNEMKFLMNSNPGLASRFPIRFEFPDYTPEELMQICQLYFDRYHYQITDDAKSALLNILMNVVSIPNYGNGRYVKTLIENQIIPNMANRIASDNAFADPIALIRIEKVDIPLNTSIKEPYRKIGFNVE
jgi:stage V sporulation protein K